MAIALPPHGGWWSAADLAGDPVAAARALLGGVLVRERDRGARVGRLVESEAYAQDDPACHAFGRETPRNRAMYGPPGRAYVYLIYGMHHCVNVVTEPAGTGSAVLIRALEPLRGAGTMARLRGQPAGSRQLTNGPGKLCQALAIDRALDGADLTREGPLFLLRPVTPPGEPVAVSPRVGITKAADYPWRFYLHGNPWVSKGPPPLPEGPPRAPAPPGPQGP